MALFIRRLPFVAQRTSNITKSLCPVISSQQLSISSQTDKCCASSPQSRRGNILSISQSSPVQHFHTTVYLRSGEVIEVEGPAFAESISEGDIKWIKQPGEFVAEDELVAEIETDKTSVEVPSPKSGFIEKWLVEDGDRVEAKQKLFTLKLGDAPAGGAAPAAKPAESPAPSSPPATAPSTPPPASGGPMSSKPVAAMQPTPAAAPRAAPPPPPAPAAKAPGSGSPMAVTGARTDTRVKINRMRNRIAARLKDAQNTYAMLTTFNEIDMTTAVELRKKYKDVFLKKHNLKFGFMSPFVKAVAYALQDQPVVNAVIEDGEIVYRHYVDISIAVATPKGLVVPVLRNAEGMNYAQIEYGINELGVKARDGALAIEDMDGGTFTISNGGVFGSMFGTPIINPPQSAILGMHGIFDRPVAINGKVEIRPMMTVALTYDHRLIDGREAVLFLRKIKQAVEDPASMFLDL